MTFGKFFTRIDMHDAHLKSGDRTAQQREATHRVGFGVVGHVEWLGHAISFEDHSVDVVGA